MTLDPELLRERAASALLAARDRTRLLTTCVEDPDLIAQHSPLMSPLVWDLAHIGNQEEQWLLRTVGGRDALRPDIDSVYDAFEHPRATRPSLPLLAPDEAHGYVADVRGRVLDILERTPLHGAPLLDSGFAFGMIAQHEQQHDETMLITHQLRHGPAVLTAPEPPPAPDDILLGRSPRLRRPVHHGHHHRALGAGQRAARAPPAGALLPDRHHTRQQRCLPAVHRGRMATRTRAGGPRRAGRRCRSTRCARRSSGSATAASGCMRRFGVTEPVPPDEPVLHVSWYEADAYARWAGRRLPSEAEWEKAARHDPATGRARRFPWGDEDPTPAHANLGQRHLRPAAIGSYPDGQSPLGVRQLIGDVWEWTASDFLPYPGFAAFPYREYSEVFFGDEYKVLRGGSFAVGEVACRGTFRNWDLPVRRQIFSGFRTARDADPAADA